MADIKVGSSGGKVVSEELLIYLHYLSLEVVGWQRFLLLLDETLIFPVNK